MVATSKTWKLRNYAPRCAVRTWLRTYRVIGHIFPHCAYLCANAPSSKTCKSGKPQKTRKLPTLKNWFTHKWSSEYKSFRKKTTLCAQYALLCILAQNARFRRLYAQFIVILGTCHGPYHSPIFSNSHLWLEYLMSITFVLPSHSQRIPR